jgi:hypothetical protein
MTEQREIYSMMCEDKPIWKDIEGYDGAYQVNQYGEVRSTKRNSKVALNDNGIGYKFIRLWKRNHEQKYYVHRLVALSFIPNVNNHPLVDHIDNNPSNNTLNNLRWVDKSLNAQNSKRPKNNTTGHKGVSCYTSKGKERFEASVGRGINRVRKSFNTLEDAIEYRQKLTELYYSKEHYIEDK